METFPEFALLKPATFEEAIELSAQHPDSAFLAGGTDLLPNRRRGIGEQPVLIDLGHIKDLQSLSWNKSGELHVGAGVTLSALTDDKRVQAEFPMIAAAAKSIAGPTHRRVATVGGNICLDTRCIYYNQSEWWRQSNNYCLKYKGDICHVARSSKICLAAFSGDLAPAFLALGATVNLAGPKGTRSIPLTDLYVEDGAAHLALHEGEFVVSLVVPSAPDAQMDYQKVSVRNSIDFPLVGVAVVVGRENGKLTHLAIAFTGLSSRPIVIDQMDQVIGKALDDEVVDHITKRIRKLARPLQSTSCPSTYRKTVAENLAIDTLNRLCS